MVVENIVRKAKIAHLKQFLLFPNVFKTCLLLMCQNEYPWSKGLIKEKTKLVTYTATFIY